MPGLEERRHPRWPRCFITLPGQGNVHKALSDLQRAILSSGGGAGPELNIANALWGQQGYRFEEPFLSLLKRDYGSPLRTVDFKGNPSGAAAEINEWASHETRGRITDIIDPAGFLPLTRLILANAIYFKGIWSQPFREAAYQRSGFHPAGRK